MLFDYFLMYICIGVGINIGCFSEYIGTDSVFDKSHIFMTFNFILVTITWPLFMYFAIDKSIKNQ